MEKRSHRRRSSTRVGREGFSLVNLCLLTFFTVISTYLAFLVLTYKILDFKFLNVILLGLLLMIFILGLVLLLTRRAKWFNRLMLVVASILVGLGTFVAKSTINVANQLNYTASFSQVDLSVVVAQDSPLSAIDQVEDLLAPKNDQANVDDLISNIKASQGLDLKKTEVESYQAAYEAILADGKKAMVLNGAYASLLESEDPDFASKVKTLYTTNVKKAVEARPKANEQEVADKDSFNIYISGIDTHGAISSVSRSDVNIIMTVNRKTKQVLLTTTPRDSYVPIAGGGNNQPDKLTHAGIYGVNASIETLENLYGIEIDYYARLNFTSFVQLIDLVGGVDVYNDQEFTNGGNHFPVGQLHLDATKALQFVRERYGLRNGDNDRGKNQEKVIAALIQKLSSKQALANVPQLLDGIGQSIQTDMPAATIMELVNNQLDSGGSYQVTSQALEGTGSTGQLPSYAMPGAALYMFSIDQNSLAQAKQAIQTTMEGQ